MILKREWAYVNEVLVLSFLSVKSLATTKGLQVIYFLIPAFYGNYLTNKSF